jgi:hypothetical protein
MIADLRAPEFYVAIRSLISFLIFTGLSPFSANQFYSFVNSWHDWPMLIAVSTLSPVNTHTLTPAFLISLIVVPTSTYNLSSIAEQPASKKLFSISSAHFPISISRFYVDDWAALNLSTQS